MVADTQPISERDQPDAYKLAARHESLYILIVADDNDDGCVAVLFLVFPSSVNSLPFHRSLSAFPSFPNTPTRTTHSQLQTHRTLALGTDLSRKWGKIYAVSKERIFSLYILLFACVFNYRLNNKSHRLTGKDRYTLEKLSPKKQILYILTFPISSSLLLSLLLSPSLSLLNPAAPSFYHLRNNKADWPWSGL